MSYTVQQLLALAARFEKMAVDIPQPPDFGEDFEKYQKMLDPKPENDDDAYQKWLKDTGPLDEEIPVEEVDDLPFKEEGLPSEMKADTYIRTAQKKKTKIELTPFEERIAEEEQAKKDHPANWSNKDWLKYLQKGKTKDTNKLDMSAKVRNRGDVVFSAESSNVSDHKDHFELNTIDQAHAALSYAGHYKNAPPWYKGSLEQLKETIHRKVKAKYPSIEISGTGKKKSYVIVNQRIFSKYGQ